jgi:hypothetical protein
MEAIFTEKNITITMCLIAGIYIIVGIKILNRIYGEEIDRQSPDPLTRFIVKEQMFRVAVLIWPLLWLNHRLHFSDDQPAEEKPHDNDKTRG